MYVVLLLHVCIIIVCTLFVWLAALDCLSPSVVDSVTPVELVLSLSSISAWRDSSTGQLLLQPGSAPLRREEPSESMHVGRSAVK